MKHILTLILAAILVASCGVATHTRITETAFIDYRPYTSAGFFLSPDPYTGAFDALGEVIVYVTPAILPRAQAVRKAATTFADGVYNNAGTTSAYVYEKVGAEDLLEDAVKIAKEMGANGLVDIDVQVVPTGDAVDLTVHILTGLAILRK